MASPKLQATATYVAKNFIETKNYENIKYYSDLCRITYIYVLGGIHLDVDIGIGNMDLTVVYTHYQGGENVPLMGTLLRDSLDYISATYLKLVKYRKNGVRKSEMQDYTECIMSILRQIETAACMYNAILGSKANNPNVLFAINKFINDNCVWNKAIVTGINSGMSLNKYLILGMEYKNEYALLLYDLCKYSIPPYALQLEHLTDDSEVSKKD